MAVEFVEELKIFKPKDGAPSWVIANGELNGRRIVICESKNGKYYAKYDNYKPKQADEPVPSPQRPVSAPVENTDSGEDGMDPLPF